MDCTCPVHTCKADPRNKRRKTVQHTKSACGANGQTDAQSAGCRARGFRHRAGVAGSAGLLTGVLVEATCRVHDRSMRPTPANGQIRFGSPGGHGRQNSSPVRSAYLPIGHSTQLCVPGLSWYLPATMRIQLSSERSQVNREAGRPMAQGVHSVRPSSLLYDPGGHDLAKQQS